MIQIQNVTITHRKDLRTIIHNMSFVLNAGDKAVIVGEEGNGKSTLLKWMVTPSLVENYVEVTGSIIKNNEVIGYLPQELTSEDKAKTVYEFFSSDDSFWNITSKDLVLYAKKFRLPEDFFYSDQIMGSLSGGERIKACLLKVLLNNPTALLLDEPSNDIDLNTLELLENIIQNFKGIVLFISHDEVLINHTANMIIHLEQIKRKTESRYTVAHLDYASYIRRREDMFQKQEQLADNQRLEKRKRDEKYRRIMQSVEYAQETITRQDPAKARLLKKKMHAVKSMEHRFSREDENMVDRPDYESEIYFKLGNESSIIPNGKTVLDFTLEELKTIDGSKTLAKDIYLRIQGSEKICIVGDNGCGKTTLLKIIVENLRSRRDIRMAYMPQNYEELLDLDATPIDFLNMSGEKEDETKIRTYLGALKYTADEMNHPIRELSGGQKAKVYLLKMSLSDANVLILDEPTRNFSPMSGTVIRQMIKDFPGAVISVSHDRKYIDEVCDRVYEMKPVVLG